eukprot:TRINITY_DN574_c0_g1_i3.p1 TRINITY_DN574_c0_g1~~TRINITY_DN574_c0_g1_i3.p1  ORF type:complete len:474 (+),score=160.12 TRINITY_DN574_c0_g1_i3:648-2069(+)
MSGTEASFLCSRLFQLKKKMSYGTWVDTDNPVSETDRESGGNSSTNVSGRAYQDTQASKRKRRELPPPPTLDDLDMKNKAPVTKGKGKMIGSQYENVKPKVSSRRQMEQLIAEQEADGGWEDDELLYDSDDEELLDLHRLISGRRGMTLEHAMERENQLMLSQERLEAIREHYEQIGDVSERLISIVGEVVPKEEEQFETFDVHRQDFMENVGRSVAADLFEHIKIDDLRDELWNLHEWMDGTLDRETEDDFDMLEKEQEDRESLINNAKYVVDGIVAELTNEKNQVFDVWSQLTSAQHQLTDKQQAALDAYQKKLKNARDETVKSRRRHPRDSGDSERSVVKKLQDRENQIEALKEELAELEKQMAEKQRKHTEEIRFLKNQMIDESIRSMKDDGDDSNLTLSPLERLQRENARDKERLKELETKLQKAQENIFSLSSLLQAIPSEGGEESQSRALLSHMVDMQKQRDAHEE